MEISHYPDRLASSDAKVIAVIDGNIVGVEYKNQIGLAFHPEMTNDNRIHEYFLKKVQANLLEQGD